MLLPAKLMTPTEIGDYLIRKDYLYEEDDFSKRLSALVEKTKKNEKKACVFDFLMIE